MNTTAQKIKLLCISLLGYCFYNSLIYICRITHNTILYSFSSNILRNRVLDIILYFAIFGAFYLIKLLLSKILKSEEYVYRSLSIIGILFIVMNLYLIFDLLLFNETGYMYHILLVVLGIFLFFYSRSHLRAFVSDSRDVSSPKNYFVLVIIISLVLLSASWFICVKQAMAIEKLRVDLAILSDEVISLNQEINNYEEEFKKLHRSLNSSEENYSRLLNEYHALQDEYTDAIRVLHGW